jgi:hypothetical protein
MHLFPSPLMPDCAVCVCVCVCVCSHVIDHPRSLFACSLAAAHLHTDELCEEESLGSLDSSTASSGAEEPLAPQHSASQSSSSDGVLTVEDSSGAEPRRSAVPATEHEEENEEEEAEEDGQEDGEWEETVHSERSASATQPGMPGEAAEDDEDGDTQGTRTNNPLHGEVGDGEVEEDEEADDQDEEDWDEGEEEGVGWLIGVASDSEERDTTQPKDKKAGDDEDEQAIYQQAQAYHREDEERIAEGELDEEADEVHDEEYHGEVYDEEEHSAPEKHEATRRSERSRRGSRKRSSRSTSHYSTRRRDRTPEPLRKRERTERIAVDSASEVR